MIPAVVEKTYTSENLPNPLACLCGRKKIAKEGKFLPFVKPACR
jgi:hypothetical protein